jgi:4-hydroxy-4-methyl-2-oxoglutarate aldolase
MDNYLLSREFSSLSTPLISDACLRLEISLRSAPAGISPLIADSHIAGRVLPVRHCGSVDIFLEAMGFCQDGDVLVIDNNGRMDEGCIGDLTALEAQACKLTGIIVWGCHRDTRDLKKIGFPIFSYGVCPAGPRRLDKRDSDLFGSANFGEVLVKAEDVVFADADGVLFVPAMQVEEVLSTAKVIYHTERRQAEAIQSGVKLREQLKFDEYLKERFSNPSLTFRNYLRQIGGAIEE